MEIFPRDIVWRAGGKSLQRYGTLTARRQIGSRGGEDAKETFARAGTRRVKSSAPSGLICASGNAAVDWPGSLGSATWLFEGARTQLVTDPQNFGAWTVEGTPVLTSGQADPFGGTAAYLINDDDGAVLERIRQDVGFSAGTAERAIAVFMRANTSTSSRFGIFDNTAGAFRHLVTVTWTAGVPTLSTNVGSGTLYTPENWGGGYYRLAASVVGVIGANTNRFYVQPTDNTAATTGSVYAFGANAWNAIFPSAYQGPGEATGVAEYATWPLPLYPGQDMTLYMKWYLRSLDTTADRVLCQLGATDTSTANLTLKLSSNNLVAAYTTAAGNSTGTLALGSPTLPVTLEARVTLAANGAVTLGYATAGGAETTNAGGALTPTPWNTPKIMVGGRTTNLGAFGGLIDGFLVRGLPSLTDLRAVP